MSSPLKTYLVDGSHISEKDYLRAEELATKDGITFMHALESLNVIPEAQILDLFSKFYRIPKAKLEEMDIPPPIIALLPKELAVKHRVLPIDRAGNNIIIATGDPRNQDTINAIRFSVGFFPKPVLACETQITEALTKYYGKSLDIDTIHEVGDVQARSTAKAERQDISSNEKGDGPIIKLVNQIMIQCLVRRASDIHIEPYESYLRIRLRIDGVLHEIARPPISMKAPLISRIKIMAQLDIAETRLPQDGAINITIDGKPVDFRVSSLPTVYGEKTVMRILDKSNLKTDMTQLGFDADELKKFKAAIHNPFGMVLVTGPTGSGKTTTLYSALAELNKESDNIMTAEDPVEYNLEGINQVQMKSDIGLTFASALRSFLRQDPDIIMVGEIRDLETAEIAIKAALTGHMVLSTLHTNSAPDTISRLLNMGVESFNLVSALTCVTAQRLMRKICEKCRVLDDSVTPQIMIDLGIHPQYADKVKAYKGAGCPACGGTGNKGRVAVHEVLKLSDPVREAILENAPAMKIKKIAMINGMRSLRQSALNKMAQGIANAQEVIKSTASDSDDAHQNKQKKGAA
ncbi:MAG: type IV-A pilus assembly ATPase PilB [Proteobacteria bacterium]|nr:type IV-A pilus assembly ATPase PilB [Pseudomonadota bacterium]